MIYTAKDLLCDYNVNKGNITTILKDLINSKLDVKLDDSWRVIKFTFDSKTEWVNEVAVLLENSNDERKCYRLVNFYRYVDYLNSRLETITIDL